MSDPDPAPSIHLVLKALGSQFLEAKLEVDSDSDCIVDDGDQEAIRIYESGGTLRVEPMSSDIPAFLNGTPLKQSAPLANKDVVQFGQSAEITAHLTLPKPPAAQPAPVESAAPGAGPDRRLIAAAAVFLLLLALGLTAWFQSEKSEPAPAVATAPGLPSTTVPTPEAQPQVQLRAVEPDILEAPPSLPPPPEPAATPDEWTIDLDAEIGCLIWNEATRSLIAGTGDGRLLEINPETGETLRTLQAHARSVSAIAMSTDGNYMATASYDNTIKVFKSFSDSDPRRLAAHVSPVRAIDVHPFKPLLASAGADGFVMLWDLESGSDIAWMLGHIGMVNAVKFSPDGSTLFSAGSDGTIQVWDVTTGKKIAIMPEPRSGINALAFSPDGTRLVSAADGFLSAVDGIILTPEQTLRVWDPATLQEIEQPIEIEEWLLAVSFSNDGRHILVSTGGHPARPRDAQLVPKAVVVDASSGSVEGARGGPLGPITGIIPHPDNSHYFTGSTDQMLRRLKMPE